MFSRKESSSPWAWRFCCWLWVSPCRARARVWETKRQRMVVAAAAAAAVVAVAAAGVVSRVRPCHCCKLARTLRTAMTVRSVKQETWQLKRKLWFLFYHQWLATEHIAVEGRDYETASGNNKNGSLLKTRPATKSDSLKNFFLNLMPKPRNRPQIKLSISHYGKRSFYGYSKVRP